MADMYKYLGPYNPYTKEELHMMAAETDRYDFITDTVKPEAVSPPPKMEEEVTEGKTEEKIDIESTENTDGNAFFNMMRIHDGLARHSSERINSENWYIIPPGGGPIMISPTDINTSENDIRRVAHVQMSFHLTALQFREFGTRARNYWNRFSIPGGVS